MDNRPVLPGEGKIEASASNNSYVLPEFKVSGCFSDHMVLQRDVPAHVFGFCSHDGAVVYGDWNGEVVSATAANGRFTLTFSPHPASKTPTRMKVYCEYGTREFDDILVGDVYLIGGQSNAEHNLSGCMYALPEWESRFDESEPIRLFRQTQGAAAAHTEFHAVASEDIIEPDWCWKRPSREAALEFSAIGYCFAKYVREKVDVPIGMFMMCAGGACLRELMPRSLAEELGYTQGANVPVGAYYNTLIHPLEGMQFKAQMYFQGESEGIWKEMALSYDKDLARMIDDEKQRFGVDFPFYNVQCSSLWKDRLEYFVHLRFVRARQVSAEKYIPRYHLAVTRDLGSRPQDPDWAHFPRKDIVGKRLADLVLAYEYACGCADAAEAPVAVLSDRQEDGSLLLTFAHAADGLTAEDKENVKGFEVLYDDGTEEALPGRIVSRNRIRLVPQKKVVREVRYALRSDAFMEDADLANSLGMPVPTFII